MVKLINKNVVAYLRRNGVYIRYTHPYHPNMNDFVERSVRSVRLVRSVRSVKLIRSIKDLANV